MILFMESRNWKDNIWYRSY